MKAKRLVCVLFLCLLSFASWAQVAYVTIQPPVDEVHDADVRIRRVELTATNTVMYMTFQHRTSGKSPNSPPRPVPFEFPPNEMTSTIQFDPTARLYANRGDKSYKFIRAENIPTRQRIDVSQGQRVDFVAYFERLDPGVTVFDLFECNDREGNICFNFYGVHVTNPRIAKKPVKPVPATPLPRKPVPATPVPVLPAKPVPATPTPTRPNTASAVVPTATIAIQGTVRDSKTSKPVGATFSCQRISGKTPGAPEIIRTDAQTGLYRAVVNPATVYTLTVSAKGYFSQTDTLTTNRTDIQRDLLLTPIETGAKLTLQNIEFDAGQFALRPQSYPELNQLVQLLRTNPTLKIRLEGHTDVVGEFDANLTLSRSRVKEVKGYLVKKGIDAGRIDTIGYGASRPLVNKSAEQNRRVELVITQS